MPEAENRKGQKLTGKKGKKEGLTQRPGNSKKWGLEKRLSWYTHPKWGGGGHSNRSERPVETGQNVRKEKDRQRWGQGRAGPDLEESQRN